jgi:hypothetical protein
VSALEIPGYEIVVHHTGSSAPNRVVLRQGEHVLQGPEAFLTAVEAVGATTPEALARLGATLSDPHGVDRPPWQPGQAILGAASPEPPKLQGRSVVYWRTHPNLPEMTIVTVSLESGRASFSRPGAGLPSLDTPPQRDPSVPAAREALSTGDVDAIRTALSAVAASGEPQAGAFLQEFLAGDTRAFLRKAVIEQIGRHKTPGGQPALAHALLHDTERDVRRTAARALENWGSPTEAREALVQASQQDLDAVVRAIAARALAKLP